MEQSQKLLLYYSITVTSELNLLAEIIQLHFCLLGRQLPLLQVKPGQLQFTL